MRIGGAFNFSHLEQLPALTRLVYLEIKIELPTEEPTASVARAVQLFRSLPALTDLRLEANIWSLAWFSLPTLRALRADTHHVDPERPAEFVPACAHLEHCEAHHVPTTPFVDVNVVLDPVVLALTLLRHCAHLRGLVLPRHSSNNTPLEQKLAFLEQGELGVRGRG